MRRMDPVLAACFGFGAGACWMGIVWLLADGVA